MVRVAQAREIKKKHTLKALSDLAIYDKFEIAR